MIKRIKYLLFLAVTVTFLLSSSVAAANGLDAGIYYVKARSELKKYYKMTADFVLSRKVLF